MNKSESKNMLPPPTQFQTEKPPCIRAVLMEFAVSEIRLDFTNRMDEIINEFMRNDRKLNRPAAFVMASHQLDIQLNPYIEMSQAIMAPYRTTLYNAQALEAQGKPEGAAVLYEKLVEAAFTASMPYDRLRIIYTKQKEYEKAIAACQSFIATLTMLQSFQPQPQNVTQIEAYKIHIEKLKLKLGKTVNGES